MVVSLYFVDAVIKIQGRSPPAGWAAVPDTDSTNMPDSKLEAETAWSYV
jgi:hypothetical protein